MHLTMELQRGKGESTFEQGLKVWPPVHVLLSRGKDSGKMECWVHKDAESKLEVTFMHLKETWEQEDRKDIIEIDIKGPELPATCLGTRASLHSNVHRSSMRTRAI